MQRELSAAIRAASAEAPTVRQSWRVKDVIAGNTPACPTLESAIDERIAAGASVESVMEIAHVIVRNTRQKLIDARPDFAAMVSSLDTAMLYETQVQGPADVAQMETFRSRCATTLRALVNRLTPHRDALEITIVAAEREIAERERQAVVSRSRFGLTTTGRAS
jgi:hypothetical protein